MIPPPAARKKRSQRTPRTTPVEREFKRFQRSINLVWKEVEGVMRARGKNPVESYEAARSIKLGLHCENHSAGAEFIGVVEVEVASFKERKKQDRIDKLKRATP